MYVIHSGDNAVIIDCGSESEETTSQLANMISSLHVEKVQAYVVTHYHQDHTQGIPFLASHFPAQIYVHKADGKQAARYLQTERDSLFDPPSELAIDDVSLTILHQPGHTHGHLHILVQPDNVLIVGDHMAGTGTVWIGPPDGHLSDYYRALQHIQNSDARFALPGHGPIIDHPQRESLNLYNHRQFREQQILAYLKEPRTVDDIVFHVYQDRQIEAIFDVARRTVQAHLAHLSDAGQIVRIASPPDFKIYYRQVEA